jgi:hypothetical protein
MDRLQHSMKQARIHTHIKQFLYMFIVLGRGEVEQVDVGL